MNTTFTETIIETFKVVSCYTCGTRFGIISELYRRVAIDAIGSIYCPACGHQTCWRESDDQKKIKELERKLEWEANEVTKQRLARKEVEASLNATKGVVTRMKKRIGNGICPCCHRNFHNLKRHMNTKHPKYITENPND